MSLARPSPNLPLPPNPSLAKSVGVAVALFVSVLALRLPFLNHPWPVHGDEAEFVAAIGFPRPYPVHHPGYPLWVAAGTLLTRFGVEPYRAFACWSVLASAVAPSVLYLTLVRFVACGTAVCAALAFALNPLMWFHSVAALNYAPAVTIGMFVFALCVRAYATGQQGALFGALGVLAVALGLRPDMLLWFGPAVVWIAWRQRKRRGLFVGATLVVAAAAWGGVGRSLYGASGGPSLSHTLDVLLETSVVRRGLADGLLRNAAKLAVYLVWSLGFAFLPLTLFARRTRSAADATRPLLQLAALVILPIVAFQLLVHITEVGHALWCIPFAYVALAIGVSAGSPKKSQAWLLLVAGASAAQFLFYPWSADVKGLRRTLNAKVGFVSASGLRQIDQRSRIHAPNDFWAVPDRPHGD